MHSLAIPNLVASAHVVLSGRYGDVQRLARQRGLCRQAIYRQSQRLRQRLQDDPLRLAQAQWQLAHLQHQVADLQQQLAHAVVLDDAKQTEFACLAQARGLSLADSHTLLDLLVPGHALSVASLGRRTQVLAAKAGPLLQVLDEFTQPYVREVAADEIYVSNPVLMVVEPESLCWLNGRLSAHASGEAWFQELKVWSHLEQVTRDGGCGLTKGVALVNEARQEQEPEATPVTDQGDHYHALRGAGVGLRRVQQQAEKALAQAEKAEKTLATCQRQGSKQTGYATKAGQAWVAAEQAMDRWQELEQHWQRAQAALRLITPEGELNSRAHAEAKLAASLAGLPEEDFGKVKRQMQKPEMLNYLDRVHSQLEALPYEAEVKQAAVRQESLRRRPELLKGDSAVAAVQRGVLLVCAVILSQAGEVGAEAVAAVQEILGRAYRASSLVECLNSVLRMQQARHRKLTQGLLDLKRLYWNSHEFRTGRRRKTTPYQRLGVPWPKELRWWDVLQLTPEQLRDKLSPTKKAA